jgi:long-chain acyl-CoA synthetase
MSAVVDPTSVPDTLALLPEWVAERYSREDLIGRSTAAGITWMSGAQLMDRARALAVGLWSLGLAKGDRTLVLAESRPDWLVVDFAALMCGGVTTPVYPTLAADQIGFILGDCEARLAVCSTPQQLEKLLAVAHTAPALTAIVVMDPPATLPTHDRVVVVTLDDVIAKGRRELDADPGAGQRLAETTRQVAASDLATLIYTSGTTGTPKGVMLTHDNLMSNLRDIRQVLALSDDDVALSFLPLCHTFERMVACVYLSYGTSMVFAESNDTLARDLLQVRPTVMTAVPRVFEKFQARILERGAALSGIQRLLFTWAMGVARERGRLLPEGKPLSLAMRVASALAERLVFVKVRAGLGGRFRFVVSGSAPLVTDVGRFFYGLGLPIIEGYGLTETSPVLTVTPHRAVRFGAVGLPLPGVRLKIADDGEILAQGRNVMLGYYHRPEETAEALRDGWFHTGDIGSIDADGYLHITDRKKELLVTSGGKKIAPQPIEGLLRAHPLVSEAVLVGEQRHFPAVLLVPDFAALAHELQIERPASDAAAAAIVQRADVVERYAGVVAQVNAGLAQFEQMKQFRLLPREFSMATGELTPTLKVKRRVIETMYRDVIDDIYRAQ